MHSHKIDPQKYKHKNRIFILKKMMFDIMFIVILPLFIAI